MVSVSMHPDIGVRYTLASVLCSAQHSKLWHIVKTLIFHLSPTQLDHTIILLWLCSDNVRANVRAILPHSIQI